MGGEGGHFILTWARAADKPGEFPGHDTQFGCAKGDSPQPPTASPANLLAILPRRLSHMGFEDDAHVFAMTKAGLLGDHPDRHVGFGQQFANSFDPRAHDLVVNRTAQNAPEPSLQSAARERNMTHHVLDPDRAPGVFPG